MVPGYMGRLPPGFMASHVSTERDSCFVLRVQRAGPGARVKGQGAECSLSACLCADSRLVCRHLCVRLTGAMGLCRDMGLCASRPPRQLRQQLQPSTKRTSRDARWLCDWIATLETRAHFAEMVACGSAAMRGHQSLRNGACAASTQQQRPCSLWHVSRIALAAMLTEFSGPGVGHRRPQRTRCSVPPP